MARIPGEPLHRGEGFKPPKEVRRFEYEPPSPKCKRAFAERAETAGSRPGSELRVRTSVPTPAQNKTLREVRAIPGLAVPVLQLDVVLPGASATGGSEREVRARGRQQVTRAKMAVSKSVGHGHFQYKIQNSQAST